ncbi:substrate-binding domain-containing protein [Collinsella intestinalis]|uniref:substrate-binding domain-containing protein n=1 Tax=Collinsella intestinalis TaxID=147207 RepID=UPI00195D53F6|nr:substrate-binding domain-containing protein [Collinsella intestinalis]MBM6907749.1 ABC transporter substrate-binding protein [Collinsella intestinalis]
MSNLNEFMISRRSVLAGLGGVGLAAAGLAGCSGNETPAQGSAGSAASGSDYEPVTLRVAYMPNLGSASSLFTAIDQGYFDEYGITVEPAQFQGGPAEITAMQSGDIDIAQIGHGAHSLCIGGDAVVFAFDQLSQADAVVCDKSKVASAEELAGKTVGVSSGTSSEIILQFVLRDAGLTMDDINPIEMDVSGMTTALLSGQIDAAATWSPNTVTIEEQLGDNYLVLGTNTDYSDEVAFPSSFVCLPDYAEENAEVLARFGAAIDKAQQYRAENIEEVAKLLSSELDVPEETMVAATGEGDWQGAVDCQGDTDTILGYYTAQQQVFLDNGTVEAEVPVEDYVKTDIMEEAYTLSQE